MAIVPANRVESLMCSLNRSEAYTIQKRLIDNWEPKSEAWTLKYGHGIVGIAAALNGYLINSLFRRKLKLLYNGYIVTSILLSSGPGAIAALSHEHLISTKIVLHEVGCFPCEAMKASLALNLNGIAYPLIAAPAVSLGIAGTMGYRIPHISEYRELLKFWWSVFKPSSGKFAYLMLLNTVLASAVTYKQFKSMEFITKILQLVENRSYSEKNSNQTFDIL